ncbi:transcriptional regulator [Vibrio pectenicida]|uniref:Transcriptional regulator n=1 Tax=Vibrio pectenicida TaxID=62763 RepID=A0A7Y4EGG1_9VIBR|nr:WYL domain-containing protein [Vibrio pectenicida]NOH73341.1 transcriptional regulator [Vibrio pectenicida]
MYTYKELKEEHTNNADRLAYIDFMLRFTGIVKRSDIGGMFNLSDAAASKVLADYSRVWGSNIEYNRSLRANAIVRNNYNPVIELDAETSLGMLAHGFNKNKLHQVAKTTIPFEKIGRVSNELSVEFIASITRAINGKYAISCEYLSENSNNHSRRIIIPLAIMHDGVNWMFRGYHRDGNNKVFFKNFHFSRALDVVEHFEGREYKALPHETLESDKEWNLVLPLQLRIHPDRDESQKRRIRIDFGIPDNKDTLTTSVRCAFLWIMEREWFIDSKNDEENSDTKRSKFFQFELLNAEMLKLVKDSNL